MPVEGRPLVRMTWHRKHIPVGVKLHACLLLLGFTDEEIEAGIDWDHQPAIQNREVIDGAIHPPANDPHFLHPMRREAHKVKTFGPGGEHRICSAGSDNHERHHTRRLSKAHTDFRERLLMPDKGKETKNQPKKRAWPKRSFKQGGGK